MSLHGKRRREDEDEEEFFQLRNEHKKPRCLPFRTSPTTKHTLLFSQSPRHQHVKPTFHFPTPITPTESSDEDSTVPRPGPLPTFRPVPSRTRSQPVLPLLRIGEALSYSSGIDTDMLDSPTSPPHPPSHEPIGTSSPTLPSSATTMPPPPIPQTPRPTASTFRFPSLSRSHQGHHPAPHQPQQPIRLSIPNPNSCETRIPTPITKAFPPAPHHTLQRSSTLPVLPTSWSNSSTAPPTLFVPTHRRRLPSPITEASPIESPTSLTSQILSNLNLHRGSLPSPKTQMHQVRGSRMQTPEIPGPLFVDGNEDMEMNGVVEGVAEVGFEDGNALGFRRGAVARGMGGGAEERGKVALNRGFRDECGNGRERVPGHWSHVVTV